jgi:hypothetical protein
MDQDRLVLVDANQREGGAAEPGQRQSERFRKSHEAPQTRMLRFCQLSTGQALFQRETTAAQILQTNPETLQS